MAVSTVSAAVATLYQYPVKGLSPQALNEARLEAGQSFPGDRLFAVENGPSGFESARPEHQPKIKYLMLARNGSLARLKTRFNASSLVLTMETDHGELIEGCLADEQGRAKIERFLTTYLPDELRGAPKILRAPGFHFMDSKSGFVSLVNLASVRALEKLSGKPVDPLRFRANIYVDGLEPWQEFDLVGSSLRIGGARFTVLTRTKRCAATQVNPATGERDIDMLRLMESNLRHCDCGIYLAITGSGTIAVNDQMSLAITTAD